MTSVSFLNESLNKLIKDTFDKLFKDIADKYGTSAGIPFDEKTLHSIYCIDGVISHTEPKLIYPKNTERIDIERCEARVWYPIVTYNKDTEQWQYGNQCSRGKINKYCRTHMKKLPHGRYDSPPPHNFFDKYK
jgi:hypothetical protein